MFRAPSRPNGGGNGTVALMETAANHHEGRQSGPLAAADAGDDSAKGGPDSPRGSGTTQTDATGGAAGQRDRLRATGQRVA